MYSFPVAKNAVKSYFFGKKCVEKKNYEKKKKWKKYLKKFFLSKTTVNPLRKKKPYHGKKTPIMETDLTKAEMILCDMNLGWTDA